MTERPAGAVEGRPPAELASDDYSEVMSPGETTVLEARNNVPIAGKTEEEFVAAGEG